MLWEESSSMAKSGHVTILTRGVGEWNAWRKANPKVRPDLAGFDFTQIPAKYLYNSSGYRNSTQLWGIDLKDANLCSAVLTGQEIYVATLAGSDLEGALLNDTIIKNSDLRNTNLRNANLKGARLIGSDLSGADLTGSTVFGISVWGVNLQGTIENDLVLTPPSVPTITLDNIQVAQFLYSLLQNQNIGKIVDGVTNSVVLILGRFTPKRKVVLDVIREGLRARNLVPVLFDFEKPVSRDLTETVSLLAHMARFVIADITDPKSIPQELGRIIPNLPSVPVQPLILEGQDEYAMFEDFRRYPWVLEPVLYSSQGQLLKILDEQVISRAEAKAKEMIDNKKKRKGKKQDKRKDKKKKRQKH